MGYKSLSTPPQLDVLWILRQWPPSGGPIVEYCFEGTERFLSAIGPPEGGRPTTSPRGIGVRGSLNNLLVKLSLSWSQNGSIGRT